MKHWYEERPRADIKACLLIVHGAGEHAARHLTVARHFAAAGYYVGLGDLPGYGLADGKRGHIDSFQTYVDTVAAWADNMQKALPNVPRFILGHSMGGLITARYMEQQPDIAWHGVLLSAPCFALALPVPSWKKRLAAILQYWWPTLRFHNGIVVDDLCRDSEVRSKYKNDPLVENKVSVKWYYELQQAMTQVHQEVSRFKVPVWILQGGADRIVDPAATRSWYERLNVSDKQLVWIEDGYHELLQDDGKEKLMQKMLLWTENHI